MKILKTLACISLGVFLVSCGSVKPTAPEIVVHNTPVPNQPLSLIKIPIKINLTPYFEETNKAVPKTFRGGDKQCVGVSYKYKFDRKPIEFKGVGESIQFDCSGKYWVKLNYCVECSYLLSKKGNCMMPRIYASCGVDEPMRKMHVAYKSKIGITKDYRLKSKTTLTKVKALSHCKMTLFNFNATSTLEKEVRKAMKSVEKDIDKQISSIDLKPEMEATWNALSEPVDLGGYGFMYMRASRISIGDIKYKGDTVYFDVYLKAYPKIFLDTITYTPKALPNLSSHTEQEGFDVHMDIAADYDSLSSILTSSIKGTKLDIKGKEVIFDAIDIHGASGTKLTIKVDFSGSKKGTLYLTGTPIFDSEKQHISFPDLEFDIKTKSLLLKSAKWLFDKKVTDLIRTSASMDLKPYLDDMKKTLSSSLNGEIATGVTMTGEVDEILIDYIFPRREYLFVRIHSKGSLGIKM
ncbi:MAG: DUF4403 family protein [Crocinitomicaceae bacterium]|nr:DUF4403 family protein [Crocinitomicaceae bacterium]